MSNNLGEIYGTVKDGRSCITIDSSSVDVTGNLITKGIDLFMSNEYLVTADPNGILNRFNNVVNIPATDSCGNDLAANTTYEITTGPTGNINNISFVKKEPYVFSANKNADTVLPHTEDTVLDDWLVQEQKNTSFNVGDAFDGSWQCPADGLYHVIIEASFYNPQDRQYLSRLSIYINGTRVRMNVNNVNNGENNLDDYEHRTVSCSMIRTLTANDTVTFKAEARVHHGSHTYLQGIFETTTQRSVIHIIRVG